MPEADAIHTTIANPARPSANYSAKNLSILAYATGGATFFHYQHAGPLDEVLAPGFFADDDVSLFAHRNRLSVTAADAIADLVCDCRSEPMAFLVLQRVALPAAVAA